VNEWKNEIPLLIMNSVIDSYYGNDLYDLIDVCVLTHTSSF
jgi:hypothetical protein